MADPILLTSGAYSSKAVIANAQRCVNLYPEINPDKTKPPVPVTHYQRPGKTILGSPPAAGAGRGLYRATNGDLFAVVNDTVYFINAAWQFIALGNIASGTTPTSMADNGQHAGGDLVLVDGTVNGYTINMNSYAFAAIVDGTGLFVGADVVAYSQTFFLFNAPGTQNWYISLADSVTFNALDIAAKAAYADNIATIGVRQREVWLIGELSTEPWYLSGAADFPFEAIQSSFAPYGCIAKYSLANADIHLCWLAQNQQGKAVVVKSDGYEARRISNHAIEQEIQAYAFVEDAIGGSFQIEGHIFYALHFPTANKTWVYDFSTEQWHQEGWTDEDGVVNRDRTPFYANAYGYNVGLDWENGTLYRLDPDAYNDFDGPITFIRGFPHVLDSMTRVTHWSFIADIQCGTFADPDAVDTPLLSMRYSDDRGQSWGDWMTTSLGRTGEYDVSPQFNQLGMARDRVYELMWSVDAKAPLNGAYIEVETADS